MNADKQNRCFLIDYQKVVMRLLGAILCGSVMFSLNICDYVSSAVVHKENAGEMKNSVHPDQLAPLDRVIIC